MNNLFSDDVLHVISLPKAFYTANEKYVDAVILLDTVTKELILAQNTQNPAAYTEIFRIGAVPPPVLQPESWRTDVQYIPQGDFSMSPYVTSTKYNPVIGDFLLGPADNGYIELTTTAPVVTDIVLSSGLNNVSIQAINVGNVNNFLALDGQVPSYWAIEFTFSGIYTIVNPYEWIKFNINGIPCITKVYIQ